MANIPELIGGPSNFWVATRAAGYDITHPPSISGPLVFPRLTCRAGPIRITLAPRKTVLVIVDMQNYFVSPAMHRPANSASLQAAEKLKNVVIPACRELNIPILWSNWGLKPLDTLTMPPAIKHGFARDTNFTDRYKVPGLGVDIGTVNLGGGYTTRAGEALMQDTWNEEIYDPLAFLFRNGTDMKAWKNRPSGFAAGTDTDNVLRSMDAKTLLFAGCNADQCIAATLMDAACLGYDCILLSDVAASMGPAVEQEAGLEYNMEGLGFMMTCADLENGVLQG